MPMSDFNPPADVVTEIANLLHALSQVVALASFYQAEAERAQGELDTMRERIATLCASVDTSVAVWGPTATLQLGTVADLLAALTPPAETFTPAELEQMTRAYEG